MLYTIIDIYEVMRTDEIYPEASQLLFDSKKNEDSEMICTDPYKFLENL